MLIFQSAARVAELVDAHGSGPCDLTIMGVRVPPRAQNGKARATWSGPFAVSGSWLAALFGSRGGAAYSTRVGIH